MQPDPNLFESNISTLNSWNSELASELIASEKLYDFVQNPFASDYSAKMIYDGEPEIISSLSQLFETTQKSLLSGGRKISVPRFNSNYNLNQYITSSVYCGDLDVGILDYIDNLGVSKYTPDFQPSSAKGKHLVLVGSFAVAALYPLVLDNVFPNLTSVLWVDHSRSELSAALHYFDLQRLINSLREKNVSFHAIFDSNPVNARESALNYLFSCTPFALLSAEVCRSAETSSGNISIEASLLDQSILGQRFLGSLGSTHDEINQLINASCNIQESSNMPIAFSAESYDLPTDSKVAIVGSGPSLDETISILSKNKDKYFICAACSSLSALLSADILPDCIVVLERSPKIYTLLSEVAAKYPGSLEKILLFFSVTADPRIPSLFSQKRFFHRRFSSVSALFNGESLHLPLIHSGPESLNLAIDLFLHTGVREFHLFGCDFGAANPDRPRAVHSFGSNTRLLEVAVKGSNGQVFYTQPSLSVARDIFCNSISHFSGLVIYRYGVGLPLEDINGQNTIYEQSHLASYSSDGEDLDKHHLQTILLAENCSSYSHAAYVSQCLESLDSGCRSIAALVVATRLKLSQSTHWSTSLNRDLSDLLNEFATQQQDARQDHHIAIKRCVRQFLFYSLIPLHDSIDEEDYSKKCLDALKALDELLNVIDLVLKICSKSLTTQNSSYDYPDSILAFGQSLYSPLSAVV
ncbi:MAG: hypothetical protein DCO99_07520 [Synechococcus sp. XM-24]|nr:MAG: hypothetical protein DCO99_07520 [Synechococcus sp. XM-24]